MSKLKEKTFDFDSTVETFNEVSTIVLIIITVAILAFGVIWGFDQITGPMVFNEKTIAYNVEKRESERTSVKVENIIKQKGNEDVYVLSFSDFSSTLELPASMYQEYIGEGNNAISYDCETLSFYIADEWYGFSFDTSKLFGVRRIALPWENKEVSFSSTEIKEFAETLMKKQNNFSAKELSFDYDSSFTGHTNSNVLESDYATRWAYRNQKEQ